MDMDRKQTTLAALESIIEDMNAASSLCESDITDDGMDYDEVKHFVDDSEVNLDIIKGDLYVLLNDKGCASLDCILMYLGRTAMHASGWEDWENYLNVPHAAWCLRKLYDDITGEHTAGKFVTARFDHNSFYDEVTRKRHYSINLREGIMYGYEI